MESPATAVAANNLFRCLFGAGAVAAVIPVINRIGLGWTDTSAAFIWLLFSPMLWAVMKWGYGRRQDKITKGKEKEETNVQNSRGSEGYKRYACTAQMKMKLYQRGQTKLFGIDSK